MVDTVRITSVFDELAAEVVACQRCPRLRSYWEAVAARKVRRFQAETYWGRPVPGFGDPSARLLLFGLAPAAHGANRTGRMFTGDDSGNWVYEALHRFGFANQPTAVSRDDGLRLTGAYIAAAARCAPPENRPTREEIENCRPFFERELDLLAGLRVVLVLGHIAFDTYLRVLRDRGLDARGLRFSHGALYRLAAPAPPYLLCSYHPSRQNTQTRRLTRDMWHGIFRTARALVDGEGAPGARPAAP